MWMVGGWQKDYSLEVNKLMDFEKEIFSLVEAMQRLQYLEQQKDYVLKYVDGYMLETSSIKDKVRR